MATCSRQLSDPGRCFNPLPAPEYREMKSKKISVAVPKYKFQSAPCTKSTGRWIAMHNPQDLIECFNPLPAPKYREIIISISPSITAISFNPLPAPKYREMSLTRHECATRDTERFNPLPAPKYREIPAAFATNVGHIRICFNPLPAPKYREMELYGSYAG